MNLYTMVNNVIIGFNEIKIVWVVTPPHSSTHNGLRNYHTFPERVKDSKQKGDFLQS